MKKKITFIIFILLVTSKIFSEDYYYFKDESTLDGVTIYGQVIYPEGYFSDEVAKRKLSNLMLAYHIGAFTGEGSSYKKAWATCIYSQSGQQYTISLLVYSENACVITVLKGVNGDSGQEKLFQAIQNTNILSEAEMLNIFDRICNNLLDLLYK